MVQYIMLHQNPIRYNFNISHQNMAHYIHHITINMMIITTIMMIIIRIKDRLTSVYKTWKEVQMKDNEQKQQEHIEKIQNI